MATMASVGLVGVATAKMGDVVASFNAPPGAFGDLAWDGKYLYCSATGIGGIIKLDENGNIITSFTVKHLRTPRGLTYDGEYLWYAASVGENEEECIDELYKLDTEGNIISFFDPSEEILRIINETYHKEVMKVYAYDGGGLTYDGKYVNFFPQHKVWSRFDSGMSSWDSSNIIYNFDMNGNLTTYFATGRSGSGLAWDGEYFWVAAPIEGRIYKLGTKGNIITSIDAPSDYPVGLTYDSKYLWCFDLHTRKIYKIDLGKAAPPSKPSEGAPGFEAIFAVAGLLAIAYLLRRRK